MRVFRFKVFRRGAHYRVVMFEAPDVNRTFAYCGALMMREPEYFDLKRLLQAGSDRTADATVEFRGEENEVLP